MPKKSQLLQFTEACFDLAKKIYHRRSLVETVISVLKRKYGAAVTSRICWHQLHELVARRLVHNVERAMQAGIALLLWLASRLVPKGFYGALRP